jgi:hypothetical protein
MATGNILVHDISFFHTKQQKKIINSNIIFKKIIIIYNISNF